MMHEGPKVIFFDLDNTLYPHSSGVESHWKEVCVSYIEQNVGLSKQEASHATLKYHIEYGLTVKGLTKYHSVCPVEFHAYLDGQLVLEELLQSDTALKEFLDKLQCKKWVFTNGYLSYAEKVLKILGVHDSFDGITSLDLSDPCLSCKPESVFFRRAMKDAGVELVEECLFVDDSLMNIRAAKELGWATVYVNEGKKESPEDMVQFIDHEIENIFQLESILPQEVFI